LAEFSQFLLHPVVPRRLFTKGVEALLGCVKTLKRVRVGVRQLPLGEARSPHAQLDRKLATYDRADEGDQQEQRAVEEEQGELDGQYDVAAEGEAGDFRPRGVERNEDSAEGGAGQQDRGAEADDRSLGRLLSSL
jgi:hypothetical protein